MSVVYSLLWFFFLGGGGVTIVVWLVTRDILGIKLAKIWQNSCGVNLSIYILLLIVMDLMQQSFQLQDLWHYSY